MAALASTTRLDMCQTPQQTAEMNPSHWPVGTFVWDLQRLRTASAGVFRTISGTEKASGKREEKSRVQKRPLALQRS